MPFLYDSTLFLHLAPRSIADCDMAESVTQKDSWAKFKEVLVVFWDKRRLVKFEVSEDPSKDKSSLLHAVQGAFSDEFPNIAASEGISSRPSGSCIFQMESKEWGVGLVDVAGEVQDHSTIFIKQTRNFMLEGVEILAPGNVLSGNSAFTDILELRYKGLKCAGRRIKLRNYTEKQTGVNNPFQKECEFLNEICHPNIVQFLGVFFQEGEPAPILVMEFLFTNLTSCIEQYGILPKEVSYSILHDVALGLYYLHSHTPPIIHRDLSSNNVLLTPNMTAKISDLGKAKILLENDSVHRPKMTTNPGSIEFMPPEAQRGHPNYDIGIDEFSYGVVMIHVFSGRLPVPHIEPSYPKPDGTSIAVSEADRRKDYLDKIGRDHPLMDLILKCVHNYPPARAHAREIMERLAKMVEMFPFANRLEMLKHNRESTAKVMKLQSPSMEQDIATDRAERGPESVTDSPQQVTHSISSENERIETGSNSCASKNSPGMHAFVSK